MRPIRWSATVQLAGGVPLDEAIRREPGAVVDPILLERLGLKVGDQLSLGTIEVPIRATIDAEPDKLTDRLTVGPRVLVSLETLQRDRADRAGHPGALALCAEARRRRRAVGRRARQLSASASSRRCPRPASPSRDRRDPSPQVTRTLERLRQFLTLIGLTALLVGGVGVANAVATFIDRRRKVIATLKSLGATSGTILGDHPRCRCC